MTKQPGVIERKKKGKRGFNLRKKSHMMGDKPGVIKRSTDLSECNESNLVQACQSLYEDCRLGVTGTKGWENSKTTERRGVTKEPENGTSTPQF